MIVLSTDLPVVHLVRSWRDAGSLNRLCGATSGERTADPEGNGRDEHGRLMNLCPRCLRERTAQDGETTGGVA
jgi:hypothetical protein